jgi:hypothetical protein
MISTSRCHLAFSENGDDGSPTSTIKPPMKIKLFAISALIALTASFTSCIPLAVGAAAGYVAHEEGYRVENPIKKVEP